MIKKKIRFAYVHRISVLQYFYTVATVLLQQYCCSSCYSTVATVLLQQYCCNNTVATVLLQQYCCNNTVAAVLLQQYCCNSIVATVLLQPYCCNSTACTLLCILSSKVIQSWNYIIFNEILWFLAGIDQQAEIFHSSSDHKTTFFLTKSNDL